MKNAPSRVGFDRMQVLRGHALGGLAMACVVGVVVLGLHEALVMSVLCAVAALALGLAANNRLTLEHRRVQRLANLVNHTRNSVFVTDRSRRILWVNEAFTRMMGYSPEQVLGRTPDGWLGTASHEVGEHNRQAMLEISAAIAAQQPFRQRVSTVRANGSLLITQVDGEALREGGGEETYVWVQTDVHAEEIGRRRLESRARILEAMSSKVLLVDLLEELLATLTSANSLIRPMVVLVDRNAPRIATVVAPSFSSAFKRQFAGLAIAPGGLSCLDPLHTGVTSVCSDLTKDASWLKVQAEAGSSGVEACWSCPVFDRQRRVVGALIAFTHHARAPHPDEVLLVADASELLGLAVSQREVERENRTLRTAIQSADDVVFMVGETGLIQFENAAVDKRFGAVRAVGLAFADFARSHFELDDARPLVLAVTNQLPWRGQVRRRALGGNEGACFDVSVAPVSSSDSAHEGALITLRDITEALRAQRHEQLSIEGDRAKVAVAWAMSVDAPIAERCAAAMASVFQLQGFNAASTGAIFVRASLDDDFKLFAHCGKFSDALLKNAVVRTGHGLAGTVAASGQLVVTDECLEALMPGASHVCDGVGAHGHYVVPLMERPDYALGMMVLMTGPNPIRDAPRLEALTLIGELFTTAIVRDEAERSLLESSRRADEANRAKSDFLATMSHEIRTPMNGVLGFTQLLLNSELSAEQREHTQLIFNSAESLLALLNDILDFSKIEAGKLVIDPRPTAIIETVRDVVGLLRAGAERKGVAIELVAEPGVPVGLLIDGMRFRQVLLNLVGNAVKFTPSGSVRVELTVEEHGGASQLKVAVIDSGIGVSASVLPNLFGKFVQADTSTSRRFGGTGLGLAISKRLVELMGGRMGAQSVEGEGSTFWFSVPLTLASIEGARANGEARNPAMLLHRRVLLAEDNLVNQMLAKRVLEKMNASVTVAANGAEAVRLVQQQDFDIILMDCQMPEMDGYDATRAIRRWESQRVGATRLPIIAVTANAFADDIERCLTSGMDAVLTKPFKLKELEQALNRLDRPQFTLVG